MTTVALEDRGVVEVAGEDAADLLQRLVTNDVKSLGESEARYAALLSPQGKILVDFLIVADRGRFQLDCPAALAADLVRRLTMYRLRAKATIADGSGEFGIAASWPDRPTIPGTVYRDPRHDSLGYRLIAPRGELPPHSPQAMASYAEHRIAAGVPEGGVDFVYGDTFPHEANLDRLHGLDFAKGCYVGQEVVSRVEHRGTARKRVLPVMFEGTPPPAGTPVMVGEIAIGTMGSSAGGRGLALVRTDRAEEAAALGAPPTADGKHLSIALG